MADRRIHLDAQQPSALLEEGELAILTANAVTAIIEVKLILTSSELHDALDFLSPPLWINWRYIAERPRTGLPQQVSAVPFWEVFAYIDTNNNATITTEMALGVGSALPCSSA